MVILILPSHDFFFFGLCVFLLDGTALQEPYMRDPHWPSLHPKSNLPTGTNENILTVLKRVALWLLVN